MAQQARKLQGQNCRLIFLKTAIKVFFFSRTSVRFANREESKRQITNHFSKADDASLLHFSLVPILRFALPPPAKRRRGSRMIHIDKLSLNVINTVMEVPISPAQISTQTVPSLLLKYALVFFKAICHLNFTPKFCWRHLEKI